MLKHAHQNSISWAEDMLYKTQPTRSVQLLLCSKSNNITVLSISSICCSQSLSLWWYNISLHCCWFTPRSCSHIVLPIFITDITNSCHSYVCHFVILHRNPSHCRIHQLFTWNYICDFFFEVGTTYVIGTIVAIHPKMKLTSWWHPCSSSITHPPELFLPAHRCLMPSTSHSNATLTASINSCFNPFWDWTNIATMDTSSCRLT
jgi:hypothetical protein